MSTYYILASLMAFYFVGKVLLRVNLKDDNTVDTIGTPIRWTHHNNTVTSVLDCGLHPKSLQGNVSVITVKRNLTHYLLLLLNLLGERIFHGVRLVS